jgi:IclR family transcriptional regulator, pca regulon regulatory protein
VHSDSEVQRVAVHTGFDTSSIPSDHSRQAMNPKTVRKSSRVSPVVERNDDGGGWSLSVPMLREARYSQSLERGLSVLGCFTPARPVLGIADLADDLGMSRSTTHRYVITLQELGYLEQVRGRKYRLALGVCDLGMSVLHSTSLREHARPLLEELCQRTPYTVSIAVLDWSEIVYVDRVRSPRGQGSMEMGLAPGSRLPVYCTAMGKLLLAYLPERQQRDLIRELELSRHTPNTIVSKRALRAELEQIREDGLAVSDQELAVGLESIAVPVRSESDDVVAAVNIVAHSSRIGLEKLVDELAPHLVSTADRLSARLGYRRKDERHLGSINSPRYGQDTGRRV